MVCGRITLMFISTIVAASGSRALRCVSVHIEKEDLIATDGETNPCFRSSKTHIFEKIAVTNCSCNICRGNQVMVYFGKPEDSEGTGSISTIILGGTIVAGGVVLGLVIGAGATMYIFKRLRRRTVENEELQEQYITTESRDPEGGHSYTPYHVQANNTDTDNCESQIYDPVR